MQGLQASNGSSNSVLRFSKNLARLRVVDHLSKSKRHASQLLSEIRSCMEQTSDNQRMTMISHHGPRLSAMFLLQQLSQESWNSTSGWRALPQAWKPWIIAFGVALTEVQRASRLLDAVNNQNDLIRELQNEGHMNWDPSEYPESLLLEVENDILIREVQQDIASKMM